MIPAATWSFRPATRTWKNSSMFWLKIARNFARSSNGTSSRSARAKTRALKSSHDSSRFNNRASTASGTPSTVPARQERRPGLGVVVVGQAEVPIEDEALALRVSHHALPVAAELRIMWRQQLEATQDPGSEFV